MSDDQLSAFFHVLSLKRRADFIVENNDEDDEDIDDVMEDIMRQLQDRLNFDDVERAIENHHGELWMKLGIALSKWKRRNNKPGRPPLDEYEPTSYDSVDDLREDGMTAKEACEVIGVKLNSYKSHKRRQKQRNGGCK